MASSTNRASSRLGELFRGRRDYLAIQWPGLEGIALKLQVLSQSEVQEAEAAAHERMRDLKIDLNTLTVDIYEIEIAIQILHRACRDHDAPESTSFAMSVDDLRENMRGEDLSIVLGQWKAIQSRQNPVVVDDAIWPELLDAAKKKDVARSRAIALGMPSTSSPTTASQPTG